MHPTWFSRWKKYPLSVIGHIAQGAASAILASTDHEFAALIWASGFTAYQFGSFARKSQSGRGDTVGLDTFDFVVGFIPTYAGIIAFRTLFG